jgi:long-chain-fatty-acid--[acyl-carrier-protein] ligase
MRKALMLKALRWLLWALARLVLSFRYRVRIHGREQLRGLKGPVLILPNHPGMIDPPLVFTALWPDLHPRPMAFESNFRNPFASLLAKLLRAVMVPDLSQGSSSARQQAEQAVARVIEGLRKGDNHILWPSGRIQRGAVEVLGGARALSDILQAVPEAEVVLVRTRGVWGSMFSFARTGEHPRLGRCIAAGVGLLLANLFVLTPRRRIDITLERLDRRRLPGLNREELNPWLEAWYNRGGPEPPTFVPYHFLLGPRTHQFPRPSSLAEADLSRVKRETREAVAQILADKVKPEQMPAELKPETTLDQLGLDSMDRMDLGLAVEQRFGFSADDMPATVGELWALAQGLVERKPPRPPDPAWFRSPPAAPPEIKGDNIAEAFVARALAGPSEVAAADDLAGVVTCKQLLLGALLLSRRFARYPEENVGLMLPASVGNSTAFLALHLAGKLPVVLNWTTGPANLAHAARVTGLTRVVTSKKFLDRLGVTIEGVQFVYLEDLRQGIGRFEQLRAWLSVHLFPGGVARRVPRVDPNRPAVVLFTSGSEKAPKAVPLTHVNLLTEMRVGIPFLGLTRADSILGFLPAFHSFGLAVTGLMPLLAGLRVVYHPDPTDAGGLARKIAAYRPTFLAGTPTFVSYILDRAEPGQLASLRMIVVAAEKCPESVFERCARAAPDAQTLEGYGITECSPVVTVNRPGANRPGTVGQPLPCVELCVVDLETEAVLPPGRMGMLLISGPTVFPGYIAHDGPSPFRELNGKRWYVSGDLAEIDADGYVHLRGRLKRFLKAGGEMISLPALEKPFETLYPPTRDGPRVAVEGVETEGGRRIVLFSTEPISLRDANALLQQEGFRGVMRLDEVRHVAAIPLLGTGKTDYKVLRALIATGSEPRPEGSGEPLVQETSR